MLSLIDAEPIGQIWLNCLPGGKTDRPYQSRALKRSFEGLQLVCEKKLVCEKTLRLHNGPNGNNEI